MTARRALGALAGLVVAVATVAAPATARGPVASRVTIQYCTPSRCDVGPGARLFVGEVHSASSACWGGRTVQVYRVRSGKDALFAETTSEPVVPPGFGHWQVDASQAKSGRYYAKVERQTSPGSCLPDRSQTVTVRR
jgi:hypothetical protein